MIERAANLLVISAAALFTAGPVVAQQAATGAARVVRVAPDSRLSEGAPAAVPTGGGALERALAAASGPTRLELAPGHYRLEPTPYTDPSCGNCEDPAVSVPATLGARVSGQGIEIVGAAADSVFIHTGAGYGLLFEDCRECVLRGVTVTGGERDPDGRATDAAVVVRRSSVTIEECRLADNVGDPAIVRASVVGIAGIAGREGADLRVRGCRIERNSWDGIALYRGARAEIHENVVDGVDKARGAAVGGGRGVGIGLTWDAEAAIVGNLVRRYWKGIGVFVDARAEIRENVVEDVLTWGIAYWGAGSGAPVAVIRDNAIYGTGACGAMIAREAPGSPAGKMLGNVIVRAGQDERYDSGEPYCTQRPIAREAVPAGFTIRDNLLHDSRQPGEAPVEPQLTRTELEAAAAGLLDKLRRHPPLLRSAFLSEFASR